MPIVVSAPCRPSIDSLVAAVDATVYALGQAAHRGMLVICELVVEKGVDVAAMSDDGITALIAAASEGHAGIVELLLGKAKADPDAKDKVNTTETWNAMHPSIDRSENVGGGLARPLHECVRFP